MPSSKVAYHKEKGKLSQKREVENSQNFDLQTEKAALTALSVPDVIEHDYHSHEWIWLTEPPAPYITTGINHLLQIMQIITILLPTMQTVHISQGFMILYLRLIPTAKTLYIIKYCIIFRHITLYDIVI